MDLALPGTGGIDLIRDLRIRFPSVAVLVLSMHDECVYAERALRAGARGYIMKQEPPERFVEGIHAIMRNELFVSPAIANSLLNIFVEGSSRQPEQVGIQRLSDREMEVFEHIGKGFATRDIAEKFNLSPKTIETYRANIKRKLGLQKNNSLIHAAIYWFENEAAGTPVDLRPDP